MGTMSKAREGFTRKGYSIPDDYHLRLCDDERHVFEFQRGRSVIRVDTSKSWVPPYNIHADVRTVLEIVPEKLIPPGSQNYQMAKALREYANSIHFTCTLCDKKHVSPGVADNGVAIFPSETLESVRDKDQKFFLRCKECPPASKAKPPKVIGQDPPSAIGNDPPVQQRQIVVTKIT